MHSPAKTHHIAVSIMAFCAVFAMMTIISTIVWEYTAADLYDCTDPLLPGYLAPGDWVHHYGQHPIAVVHQIVHGRDMGEPDTIKAGWSVPRLRALWLAFFAVSVAISLFLTFLPRIVCWFRGERSSASPPPNSNCED